MTFEKFAIVKIHNSGMWVKRFESDKPITWEILWNYYNDVGLDWDRDSITIIDSIETITLG